MVTTLRRLVLGVLGLCFLALPARADVGFCNRSDELMSVATYTAPGEPGPKAQQIVSGWWVLDPGDCTRTYIGNHTGRWYGFYAERQSRGRWLPLFEDPGAYLWLCVDPSGAEFEYRGDQTSGGCVPGAAERKFIIVVPNQANYTIDLRIDPYF